MVFSGLDHSCEKVYPVEGHLEKKSTRGSDSFVVPRVVLA